MRPIILPALAAILVMAASTAPAAPPAIVTHGTDAVAACASCHGVEGAGNAQAGFPMLAHLPAAYLAKQLADFKAGTRSNPVMTPIAMAIGAADIDAAARYYAGLPRPRAAGEAGDPAAMSRGRNLAIHGAWDRQIPPCFKCHAAGGTGVPPVFPPIAGQNAAYTINQLQAWKAGARTNDPQKLMRTVARKLTDDDLHAVAGYLATLGPGSAELPAPPSGAPAPAAANSPTKPEPAAFSPLPESAIPDNAFGKMVLQGRNIFADTQHYAKRYVGNGLNCANCHLDNGRKAHSAPLWAAYVLYPAYRKKTGQVDTIQDRIQGCFRFSMNGTPPDLGSEEMTALVTYHYWLAQGAPTGVKLPGQGFVKVAKPALTPDIARGQAVYENNCALCHGRNGEGTRAGGGYAFPPLWGKDSFNWGAGMHRIDTAAGFIKANMPYGLGGSLSDQEAWDVALFMNSHDRPQDPRFKGSMAQTRDAYHDEDYLYGRTPDELVALRAKTERAGETPRP